MAAQKTLFHLVPTNPVAERALQHEKNKAFVSKCQDQRLGLEVGYHVPKSSQGNVMTRLGRGRDADIHLPDGDRLHPVARVHAAFEIHPSTHAVLLVPRAKATQTITFAELMDRDTRVAPEDRLPGGVEVDVVGDAVILYGQNYRITIANHKFDLIWRQASSGGADVNAAALEDLVVRWHWEAREQMQASSAAPSECPTDYHEAEESQSWVHTRAHSPSRPPIEYVAHTRELIGAGGFGRVYKATNRAKRQPFAIKVLRIGGPVIKRQQLRTSLLREIEYMKLLNHPNIMPLIWHSPINEPEPEIYMPYCEQNLYDLVERLPGEPPENQADPERPETSLDRISTDVARAMLGALDYIHWNGLVHRDIKPENILCNRVVRSSGGAESPQDPAAFEYVLADFGLANCQDAAISRCGTPHYYAPELFPRMFRGVIPAREARQSSKMDIWSLGVSLLAVITKLRGFPPPPPPPPPSGNQQPARDEQQDMRSTFERVLTLRLNYMIVALMTIIRPAQRPSAAQLLVHCGFGAAGLTTPLAAVPPFAGLPQQEPAMPPPPLATAPPPQAEASERLIQLPRQPLLPGPASPRKAPEAGVNKRRHHPYADAARGRGRAGEPSATAKLMQRLNEVGGWGAGGGGEGARPEAARQRSEKSAVPPRNPITSSPHRYPFDAA